MNKKLQKQIEKKLDKLFEILGNIEEARIINPNDPETWDPDTLYDLVEQLKKALKLLEDQESKQRDAWGEPIILEEGLCSLVDSYHEDQEEEEDDD
jgi:hypothetical protein